MEEQIISVTSTDNAITHLKRFRKNWDGHNCPAIKIKAMKTLEVILRDIEDSKLTFPKILPLHDGGVGLMWASHTRDVGLEIAPNGALSFEFSLKKYDVTGELSGEETSVGTLSCTASVDYVLAWYSSDKAGSV